MAITLRKPVNSDHIEDCLESLVIDGADCGLATLIANIESCCEIAGLINLVVFPSVHQFWPFLNEYKSISLTAMYE